MAMAMPAATSRSLRCWRWDSSFSGSKAWDSDRSDQSTTPTIFNHFVQWLNTYSNNAKLLPTLDLYSGAPTVTPGRTYNLSAWYQSTAIG